MLGCSADLSGSSGGDGGATSPGKGADLVDDSAPLGAKGPGILDCPTVAPPPYTLASAPAELSARFQSTCAGCHGPTGAGADNYPEVPGALSLVEFKDAIRSGVGSSMPSFSEADYSDADIESDYGSLQGDLAPGSESPASTSGRTHPSQWSDEDRQHILTRGLAALRTPDKFGTACANCHSPDAIELAVIAFTDGDILRRGHQHLAPNLVLDIVDYVHALRDKYEIAGTCSKDWRPFQPGGEPLPGETAEEREVAFAAELKSRKLLLMTTPIRSLKEARAAANELEAVDLRTLPVGVAFPRWSEDGFNGEEHNSFNDWMPGAGRVPKDAQSWYARHDSYLAAPSIENLAAIDNAIGAETVRSTADSKGRPIDDDYQATYDAQGWMDQVLTIKYESVLLGSHFFRMALTGGHGWEERFALPFPELPQQLNPFFHQGLVNAESPCYSNEECDREVLANLPSFMKEEFGDIGPSEMSTGILSDPWSYLGQLLDHSLLTAENSRGSTHDGHYWNLFTFEHRLVQQPFFSAHRIITQEAYFAKYRGTERYPHTLAQAAADAPIYDGFPQLPESVHPLLNGGWMDMQGMASPRVQNDDSRLPHSTYLRSNIALMVGFIQRDLLLNGEAVSRRDVLLERIEMFREAPRQLDGLLADDEFAAQNPHLVAFEDVLVGQCLALLDEVDSLVQGATEE